MLIPYKKKDFAGALLNLFPRGRAWSSGLNSTQGRIILAIGAIYERQTERAIYLIRDTFPASATEVLPEWEKTLWLPSACSGMAETLQGRRNQVVSRLVQSGGQSRQYYIGLAASLGKIISIEQYTPFRCGCRVGQPLGGEDWSFTWAVLSEKYTAISFKTGLSAVGEALRAWGDHAFECELRQVVPSHTVLQFQYLEEV